MASKKRGDYTIADMIRLEPKWLFEKQQDGGKALRKLLNRCHLMIDNGFPKLATLSFLRTFRTWDVYALSVADINKRLSQHTSPGGMSYRQMLMPVASDFVTREDLFQMSDRLKDNMRSELLAKSATIRSKNDRLANLYRSISDSRRTIEAILKENERTEAEMEALQDYINNAKDKLDMKTVRMLRNLPPTWLLIEVTRDDFVLVYMKPVDVVHTNEKAGVCATLNLGYFAFRFGIHSLETTAAWNFMDGRNKPSHETPIHPHILSDGGVCWGNLSHLHEKAQGERDLVKILSLLESLMHTYGFDSPYISLPNLKNRPYMKYHTGFWQNYGSKVQKLLPLLECNVSDEYTLSKELPNTVSTDTRMIERFVDISADVKRLLREGVATTGNLLSEIHSALTRKDVKDVILKMCERMGVPMLQPSYIFNMSVSDVFGADSQYLRLMMIYHGHPLVVEKGEQVIYFDGLSTYLDYEQCCLKISGPSFRIDSIQLRRNGDTSSWHDLNYRNTTGFAERARYSFGNAIEVTYSKLTIEALVDLCRATEHKQGRLPINFLSNVEEFDKELADWDTEEEYDDGIEVSDSEDNEDDYEDIPDNIHIDEADEDDDVYVDDSYVEDIAAGE